MRVEKLNHSVLIVGRYFAKQLMVGVLTSLRISLAYILESAFRRLQPVTYDYLRLAV